MSQRPVLLVLLAAVICGCGGTTPGLQKLPGDETDFIEAKKVFDDGDFIRAVELLTAYVDAHPGSNRLDNALLLLGLSHQRTGSQILAVDNLNRLIRDFPQSPLREEAEFERAHSHYLDSGGAAMDPENTETALDLVNAYLIRYPEGSFREQAERIADSCREKLAMKAYLNAETYLRLNRDQAALIYLKKALEMKADFKKAGEALSDLAKVCKRLDKPEEAREAWLKLLDLATPERIRQDRRLGMLRKEAEEQLGRLESGSARGSTP